MIISSFTVVSHGPGETLQVAGVLAKRLQAGDAVLLTGQLASGKTTFVKAATAALGSADVVTSPTFTLAQFYTTESGPLLHVDAYRLNDIMEYRDLGLDEYVETSITLVEWGEKVATEFSCYLSVDLRLDGDDPARRMIVFSSSCVRWSSVLSDLQGDILAAAP